LAKPEWGLKRTCQSCSARFYDLNRDQIICPKCGAVYDAEAILKSRRGRPIAPEKVEKPKPEKPKPAVEDEELEDVEADDDEDESVLEDASELGEDDDIGPVKRTGDDKDV
jgi:uncharacterized protein (TIGR02300 family)